MHSTARLKRRLTVATVIAVGAALITGTAAPGAAEAASVPTQVTGVTMTGQTWNTRSVTVHWTKATGATSYAAKWSTQSNFSSPTWGSTSGTTLTIGSLTPAKTYYLVVAGKNAAGSGRYSTTLQIKLKPQPVGQFGAVTATPTTTGVRVTFASVPNASDYRVRWSAGPNENRVPDRWSEHYSSWFSAFSTKGTWTYDVPMSAADLTSTAFGNPIYVRLQARNTYYDTTYIRKSAQASAWPTPTAPDPAGVSMRVASYNVLCSTCEPSGGAPWTTRGPAVANLVNSVDPDVLTVMEANGPSAGPGSAQVYLDLERRFSRLRLVDSSTVPSPLTEPGTRIYYDPNLFTVARSGRLPGVKDYRTYPESAAPDTQIPWAELVRRDDPKKHVIVVAAHYGVPSASYSVGKKSMLGKNSAQVLTALDRVDPLSSTGSRVPVLFSGDLNDHRYPEDETDGAQATLVGGGFYDASASRQRVGTAKSTYNSYLPPSRQVDDANLDGLRIDYILTRGFQGSSSFTNHWNPGGSAIPSDHNLIDAVVRLPAGL